MTQKAIIRIIITVVAIALAVVHIIFPKINIDAITVILVGIAAIPWLEPLFKSVGLPGGVSFQFQDLDDIEKKAKEAGLIKDNNFETVSLTTDKTYKQFTETAAANSQIALVALSMELQKKLVQAADANVSLSPAEKSVINKIITLTDRISGIPAGDERIRQWVLTNGPAILESIDKKIKS
jgi:basic membrane lipoprotein Med (substrate-binding protein (PBP1-ABC) superfamily)